MFSSKLTNEQGDYIELNTSNSPFTIIEADGLYPEGATINTSGIALIDGTKENSSKVNEKQLIIIISIDSPAEQNRINLYKVLKSKHKIRFDYVNTLRKVFIEGTIESMPITHFAQKQECTLTIKCPFPFFKEAQTIVNEIKNTKSMFTFPFAIPKTQPIPLSSIDVLSIVTIDNTGDIETGIVIEIYARNTVENPKIFNYVTGEYIGVNITMIAGDSIFINTNKGKKTITLFRQGTETNIFNDRMSGMRWLTLEYGENTFYYEADIGVYNMNVTISHNNLYIGV